MAQQPHKSWRTWLLRSVLGLFALVGVVIAGGMFWLASDTGQGYVRNLIQTEISEAAGFDMDATGIQFAFPAAARMDTLVLADARGEWLTAKDVYVSVIPGLDMVSSIIISSVEAGALQVIRQPQIPATEEPGSQSASPDVVIRNIEIEELILGSQLTGLEQDITGNATGSLTWEGKGEALQAELSGRFTGLDEALGASDIALQLAYDLPKDQITLSTLTLKNPKIELTGEMDIDLAANQLLANLQSSPADLAQWDAAMAGQAQLQAELTGTLDSPKAQAVIKTTNIVYDQQAIPDATTTITAQQQQENWGGALDVKAGENTAHATYQLAENRIILNDMRMRYLSARASGNLAVNTQTNRADGKLKINIGNLLDIADTPGSLQATLALAEQAESQRLNLQAEGRLDKPFTIDTQAHIAQPDEDTIRVQFSKLSGQYDAMPFASRGQAVISQKGNAHSLTFSELQLGKGVLSIKADKTPQRIMADIKGKGIALAEWMQPVPQQLEQAMAGITLKIQGDPATPQATADITISGIKAHDDVPAGKLQASATVQDGRADIDAVIEGGDNARSDITLNVPLTFSVEPFALDAMAEGPVKGKAKLDLDVGGLVAALLPPEHELKGTVAGTLDIAGSTASPSLSGQLTIKDGRYHYLPVGLLLPAINGRITASGQRFTLSEFTASDKEGNALTATGQVDLRNAPAWNYQLSAQGKSMHLLQHPRTNGVLTLDMDIRGNEQSGKVTGNIVSELLEIYLPDQFVQSVPELNVVKTLPDDAQKKAKQDTAYPLALDLTFKADNKVFVRGRGVDAELQGKLAITGKASKPQIEGKLTTIRGRYEEFGKTFDLKKAELLFDGDMPPSPYITIVASHKVAGTEIKPTLSGPVETPKLSVDSSPSMPEDEALSLLLFGEKPSDITPLQAVQLADSIRRLSGKGGGASLNPIGAVRDLVGVDDLSVNTGDEAADTSVGVGKYLADDVYLEVEQGADATSSKARIEVELTPSISVESSTGSTGSNEVGVNWKHDY